MLCIMLGETSSKFPRISSSLVVMASGVMSHAGLLAGFKSLIHPHGYLVLDPPAQWAACPFKLRCALSRVVLGVVPRL